MKGYNSDFGSGAAGGSGGTGGVNEGMGSGPVNGVDYNTAKSSSIKVVNNVVVTANQHTMPIDSTPNTVVKNYSNGKLSTERYFDKEGNAYLDIDYSDHGNPKTHPVVPHEHEIKITNGKFRRGKDRRIKHD